MEAHIVLGTQYGDEGKGRTVDHLCSVLPDPIVVRFSGGQQVGHTVIRDGVKHIHSNFGSGTLQGVPTYYSEFTTIYPLTIKRELEVLNEKGITPKIILNPLTRITTPFDVYVNRMDSNDLNNGTCGLGVGKTMKRTDESPFKLYAVDLLNPEILEQKIISIRDNYYSSILFSQECEKDFIEFMEFVQSYSWEVAFYYCLKKYKNLVFEGSQGILLDMDFGIFPNVTYANTTSKNAHSIIDLLDTNKNKIQRNLYYITRCYTTRHGAGYFKEEKIQLIDNDEEINVYNQYQKEFKISSLRYDLINQAIKYDLLFSNSVNKTSTLVVTCLDQLPDFKLDFDKLYYPFDDVIGFISPHYGKKSLIKLKQ